MYVYTSQFTISLLHLGSVSSIFKFANTDMLRVLHFQNKSTITTWLGLDKDHDLRTSQAKTSPTHTDL